MMRGAGGALCVAIAALLVCCSADPHQESDVNGGSRSRERYGIGHKAQALDHQESGNLIRAVRDTGFGMIPYLLLRHHEFSNPIRGGASVSPSTVTKQSTWPSPPRYWGNEDLPKRNFDEIDLSPLDTFVKRNFDEIDQTLMPFPYSKRSYRSFGLNHYDIDMPVSSFDKKRFRPEYPMDEIDLSHFPIGSKRSQNGYQALR